MIKTIAVTLTLALTSAAAANAQNFGDYLNKAENALEGKSNSTNTTNNNTGNRNGSKSGSLGNLTSSDITSGLKQALQVGTQNASKQLSSVNGFFGNALIKIVMPPEAQKVEQVLREVGMGAQVDNAILSMNRAAEDASSKAVPIFVNAITSMSIEDGLAILQGGNDAATRYLKAKTTAALTAAFRPVVQNSLDKVNATKYWAQVFNLYNQLPTSFSKVNPDLPAYVTEHALNGLFVTIAQEEAKIRLNPQARVTNLLQKVFGARK